MTMGSPLYMPRLSRKMQRTLKNLRVSLLCFLLTFLVLRNTIGAGKFGTPAQDFEEIRQHLHYVGLHRRHFRVLAEAVEEEEKHREDPMLALERRSPLPEGGVRRRNAPLRVTEEEQGNALSVGQGRAPSRPVQGGLMQGNVGVQKGLEESRMTSWDEQRKMKEAFAHGSYGGSRVLLLTMVESSGCKSPAGEHLLLKSLKNKVDYSTLHGLEMSLSFGGLDPEMAKPLSKLSLLERAMIKYPHVEWIWWMPVEAVIITDMSFKLPMHSYSEVNLVLLGSDDKTHHRKSLINLNTDTFLLRNCQWSLDLLRACAQMGTLEGDQADRLLANSLIKVPRKQANEQSASISLMHQEKLVVTNKVFVMHSAILQRSGRDAADKFQRIVRQSQRGIDDKALPFVTHFLGCNVCQKGGDREGEMCVKQMESAFVLVEKQKRGSYVLQQKSLVSS